MCGKRLDPRKNARKKENEEANEPRGTKLRFYLLKKELYPFKNRKGRDRKLREGKGGGLSYFIQNMGV